jgi:hypothetical protein
MVFNFILIKDFSTKILSLNLIFVYTSKTLNLNLKQVFVH